MNNNEIDTILDDMELCREDIIFMVNNYRMLDAIDIMWDNHCVGSVTYETFENIVTTVWDNRG